MIDLHLHSTASDASLAPEEVAACAKASGCTAISLTDHDTVAGLSRCTEACKRLGIAFVPGIEISTGGAVEMHILGYGIDPQRLENFLAPYRDDRRDRVVQMVEKIRQAGMDVTMDDVFSMAAGAPLGRPHVALCLVKKGYASSVKNAFERYIGNGRPLFVARKQLELPDVTECIHRCGGVAVLAHPVLIATPRRMLTQTLSTAVSQGLDGIEAYHSSQTPADAQELVSFARRHGLLVTGGSDFHGAVKKVQIGDGLATWHTRRDDLAALLAALAANRQQAETML